MIRVEYGNFNQIQLYINTSKGVCKGGIFIFIRENLIFLKNKTNMTWDEIAIRAKIPYRTLQNIIYRIDCNPSIKSLIILAEYFKISLDELVLIDLSK